MSTDRSSRPVARVWSLLALMLAVLLAVPPTGPSVESVAARSWLAVGTDDSGGGSDGCGETDVAAGPESGSSDDSGGGDSGGSAGAAPEVASDPSESSSDDSGGDGAGAAPEVESGPTDKPSDGGGDNGGIAEVAAAPGDKPSDGSPGGDVDIASTPGPDGHHAIMSSPHTSDDHVVAVSGPAATHPKIDLWLEC